MTPEDVLAWLREHGPVKLSGRALAARLGQPTATIARLLARLESDKFITRKNGIITVRQEKAAAVSPTVSRAVQPAELDTEATKVIDLASRKVMIQGARKVGNLPCITASQGDTESDTLSGHRAIDRLIRGTSEGASVSPAPAVAQKAEAPPETPPAPPPPAPAAIQPAHGARASEGRDWGLILLGLVCLGWGLFQASLHASEKANGDLLSMVLLAGPAFTVGIAGPFSFYKAGRRRGRDRLILILIGMACLGLNLWGSLGFVASRADQTAAFGQAVTEARARAEADLSRLRARQSQLDQDALAARNDPVCKKRPIQCRARSEKIAKEAAALIPQIQAAEKALDSREVRAAADPSSAAIARLFGFNEATVREWYPVALATILEVIASLGLGLGARKA